MPSIKTYAITATSNNSVNHSRLHQEINIDGSVTGFIGLNITNNQIEILGASLNDEIGLDAVIAAHEDVTLAEYKVMKNAAIDYKTMTFLSMGFTYDSNTFSLSIPAQTNWNVLKNSQSDFTWPVEISTIDDDVYSLESADLIAFWTSGRDMAKSHLDSGRALKKQVKDAVDKAAVDAVIDNR